jgi:hypothetical protein
VGDRRTMLALGVVIEFGERNNEFIFKFEVVFLAVSVSVAEDQGGGIS